MSNIKKVVLTRSDDTFVELNRRAEIARNNNANVFVSIHLNAFNGTAHGVETFLHNDSTASEEMARNVNDKMRSELGNLAGRTINNRGVKKANFAVLRGTYRSMLSILPEVLFMDNQQDHEVIKHKDFVKTAAAAIADGIRESLQDRNDVIVCVDAGHGGHDPGASGFGLVEKDVALKIALALRDNLEGKPSSSSNNSSSGSSSASFTNLSASQKYAEISNTVSNVRHLQNYLIAAGYPLPRFGADGKPGAETLGAIQDFQRSENISNPSGDNYGRPGPATMRRLRQLVSYGGIRRPNSPYPRGNDVRAVQRVVGVDDDSIYGPITANAVRRYQATNNLQTDGILGPETWGHMFG